MPMRGSGRSRLQRLEADGPVEQRRRVGGDDHHLVPDRLDDAGVVGQRVADPLDEALDDVDRLVLPRLLGQARVAGEVGEGDRHPQAAEVEVAVGVDLELHVADHVLVEEVLQEALVDAIHDRRGEREQVAREPLHLLRHLEVVDALVDQRLVDVEVEELDLGVRDPRQRLPVDAHELEEGDEREAGVQRRGDVAQQLEVVLGDLAEGRHREADGAPDALDQRRLEAGRPPPPPRACRSSSAAGTAPPRSRRPAGPSATPRGSRSSSGRAPAAC